MRRESCGKAHTLARRHRISWEAAYIWELTDCATLSKLLKKPALLPWCRSHAKILNMDPAWLIPPILGVDVVALVVYGAAYPRSQIFGATKYRTSSPRRLALTFDDGPNPAVTPHVLELLARYNAKATFFLVGKTVRELPSLVQEIAARGHLIGNHTETHPNLFFRGPEETRDELQRCNEAILRVTHEAPRWFRPPFGFRSPWLGPIVQQFHMRTAMWTTIPGDWRGKPPAWLIERMKPIAVRAQANGIRPKNANPSSLVRTGDVVCLHDGDYARPNGNRAATVAALQYWLPRWRDLGLEFVTMAEDSESLR
jgi:peptidoglycan/xylan/chitin deacetylase (PgdA/CDA1 family)